jgi:hypothetical protein
MLERLGIDARKEMSLIVPYFPLYAELTPCQHRIELAVAAFRLRAPL